MDIMRYFKSSFPRGQYQLRKNSNIMAFFMACDRLGKDVLGIFKRLVSDAFPTSASSASLEYWVKNFGIDDSKSKSDRYQELKQIFSGSETSSSKRYLENFFVSFGINKKNIVIKRQMTYTVLSPINTNIYNMPSSFSNIDVFINSVLGSDVKHKIKKSVRNLHYRYRFIIRDKGGII